VNSVSCARNLRLGGKPVVRGSRISVEFVVEMLADGWSEERILKSYPTFSLDDVRACLGHAAASASLEGLDFMSYPRNR
jgi:uncharacterized protein (DUF433 family)